MPNLTEIPRHRALAILIECTGDDLWGIPHCRQRGVPDDWIDGLADTHESGFQTRDDTIFVDGPVVDGPACIDGRPQNLKITNQFHGVHDLLLAMHIGRTFGVDVDRIANQIPGRQRIVEAIKQVIEEGDG